MADTVNRAFHDFMVNVVNIDPDDTKNARSSREWLMGQLTSIPTTDKEFPAIYENNHVYFGSFSRRTKTRPLDDIDLMLCLSGMGCLTYLDVSGKVTIYVNKHGIFSNYLHEGTNHLNSRKLIDRIIKNLDKVPQYKKADTLRDGEAATLDLNTYDWKFDIVPCFFTTLDEKNRNYYLIPDGKGNWKKTDPRKDQKRVNLVNDLHEGRVLAIIRLVKYWNKRPTMPTIPSYVLENMILDYYAKRGTKKAAQHIDVEFTNVLNDLKSRIYSDVQDPKEIQGNLNSVLHEERKKIAERAFTDCNRAVAARKLEDAGDQAGAVKAWGEILGPEFPKYEA